MERELHNEIHNLYSSPNIIRLIKSSEDEVVGLVARIGEMRNTYIILFRIPEESVVTGE
jgi:hypothetical protein